ncbi:MAG: carbon-nitrogen hydrolase family protein [Syntrophobacteraceae bacterium]
MNRTLGIGVCQMHTAFGQVRQNLEALAQNVARILSYSPWVKLICAHELCIQGPAAMEANAEPIPGSITEFCADLARKHQIYLVPGSLYEKVGDDYYNTAPVFSPTGEMLAQYRKMYPWRPYEKTLAGKETVVFEIPGFGVVGICICYDIWFPEVIRDLVCKGAELILAPTFTETQDRRQELILCQAAAIANQCFVVSINGLGKNAKGQSIIVDPEGNILQHAGQSPENLMAMLDLSRVDQVRTYGTCGISRPVACFLHESHRFSYQLPSEKESLPGRLQSCLGALTGSTDSKL